MVGIRGRGALIVDASFQCWTAPSSMWLLFLSIFSFSGAITLTGPQNVLENKPVTLTCKYTSTFSLEWFRNSRSFITCTTWRPCTYPTGYKSTLNQTTSVLHIDSVTTANKCWKCKPDHGTSPELCLNVEKLGHNITLSGKTRDPDSLTAWIDCSNPYYKNVVCYYKRFNSIPVMCYDAKFIVKTLSIFLRTFRRFIDSVRQHCGLCGKQRRTGSVLALVGMVV